MSQPYIDQARSIFPESGAIAPVSPGPRHGIAMAMLVALMAAGGLFAFFDLAQETAPLLSPLSLDLICLRWDWFQR
jgi:hypothetical protein